MRVTICIGSSCHIKGSRQIVEKMQRALKEYELGEKVDLAGSFCLSKCNREGVTVTVDDEVFTGITEENFNGFFTAHILKRV